MVQKIPTSLIRALPKEVVHVLWTPHLVTVGVLIRGDQSVEGWPHLGVLIRGDQSVEGWPHLGVLIRGDKSK